MRTQVWPYLAQLVQMYKLGEGNQCVISYTQNLPLIEMVLVEKNSYSGKGLLVSYMIGVDR